MSARKAYWTGVASFIPPRRVTNEELAEAVGWDAEKIFAKTGIRARGVAGEDECASDLAVSAAKALFDQGLCAPKDIDFLLFCTQSPDYFLPTTACLLQSRLGLSTTCGALDFNQGCSGFVYGLSLAKGLIESDAARNVLLVTAETYTKFVHPRDRSVRVLFGDGAAATLITGIQSELDGIGPFVFGTDGRGGKELIVPAGGLRQRCSADTGREVTDPGGNTRSADNLYMNGPEIFNFTLRTVPPVITGLLEKAQLTMDEVDYFVFHQANRFMLEHLRDKLRIPPEKFCVNMEFSGNTVSSTIPMAVGQARGAGAIRPGHRVMVVGFGVGYSWAAAMVRIV